jgi:nickel transport protein
MKLKSFYILMIILILAMAAYSHGTKYEIVKSGKIGIKAMFDTGEPMSDADVLVFPPGATSASVTEKADVKGLFYFTPDRPGTWTLQVRDKTGHGMRINLEIDETLSVKGDLQTNYGLNTIQKVIMALCVIWGATGTALYFKGRKGQA